MMLQRYTIVKNIAGKIRKINFKKQDSSKNMPVKLCMYLFIYLLKFNYTNDQNKIKNKELNIFISVKRRYLRKRHQIL